MNINHGLASSSWSQEEIDAINKVIAKNHYTMGEEVANFENEFAEKFGSRYAVMVNSGSSANLLAIAALCYKADRPLKPCDEIIVPSLSWSTTYYPIHQYGMRMVFVDIELDTLNINVEQLEDALSEKTRAVFVPNILGNPAKLIEIQEFCLKHDLYLIEDNCESMGAKIGEQYAGTFGICGTYSTFFSHHISTMEGGVITTDDEEIYHILLALRSHGWTRHLPDKNKICAKSSDLFYESFRFVLPGYNMRPIEMMGAIGRIQLRKLDELIDIRCKNAALFKDLFYNNKKFTFQREHGKSSWFGFSFIIKPDENSSRDGIVQHLLDVNVEVRPIISGNFLKQDVLKHLNHRIVGAHNNAQQVHESGFFIGNHHYDINLELTMICELLDTLTI